MGTIEKRGKNSWRVGTQVKIGGQWQWVRMSLRMDPALPEDVQRRDAKRQLKILEDRLKENSPGTTLREWAEEWLQKHVALDSSPVTVHNYRHLLDCRILPALGDVALADLTPALLTDWLIGIRSGPRRSTRLPDDQLKHSRSKGQKLLTKAEQQRPLSVSTVLHYYTCMVAMLSAAVRMGYIEHNPMDRVQRPRQRKKKLLTPSEQDAVRLLKLLAADPQRKQLRLAVLLALCCGLRLGEVCALKYADIDWDAGTLTVSHALKYTPDRGSFTDVPKTEAGDRVITLPPSLRLILREAMWDDVAFANDFPEAWHASRDVEYIVHARDGRQLHHDTPSKWFRAFADSHGFTGLRFHDLRHAHASILVAHNLDIATIASRMGHGDPGITLRTYAHAMAPRDQDAAATLDQLLAAQAPAADPAADPDPDPDADLLS